MKRRSRAALRLRAARAVGSWAIADSKLSRRDLDARRAGCWLDGYDAAMRDTRADRKKPAKSYQCAKQPCNGRVPLKGMGCSLHEPAGFPCSTPHCPLRTLIKGDRHFGPCISNIRTA